MMVELREADRIPSHKNEGMSERALKAAAKSRTGIAVGDFGECRKAKVFATNTRNFIKRNKLEKQFKCVQRGTEVYIQQLGRGDAK